MLYVDTTALAAALPGDQDGNKDADRIEQVAQEASSWVDSCYPGIAPFAAIGSGKFATPAVATFVGADVNGISLLTGIGVALAEGDQFQTENYNLSSSQYNSRRGIFRGWNNQGPDYFRSDYTIYTITEAVEATGAAISFSPNFRVGIDEGRHLVIGTPPLIRQAAFLYATWLWVMQSAKSSKEADKRKTAAEKMLSVDQDGRAMKSPHPLLWRP